MSDELRQAAERLRRVERLGYSGLCDVYETIEAQPLGELSLLHQQDKDAIVAAYLSEHPADDCEAVTEEWLRAVGFDADEYAANLALPDFWHPDWPEDVTSTLLIIHKDGTCFLSQGPDESIEWPKTIKTRGGVRKLAAVLGIELKGGGQ